MRQCDRTKHQTGRITPPLTSPDPHLLSPRWRSMRKAMPGMKHQKERVGAGSLSWPQLFSMRTWRERRWGRRGEGEVRGKG